MDDEGLRGNGIGKADPYKSICQWMIPPSHFKDQQSLKFVEAFAERDAAIHEMNLAMAEKKQAIAERDIAVLQRDQALNDMNKVIVERDSALAALEYTRENSRNSSGIGCPSCPPCNCYGVLIAKQMHREAAYNVRELHITRAHPISSNADSVVKPLHDRKHPNGAKSKAHVAAGKEKELDSKRKKTLEELELVHDINDEDPNDVNTVIKNVGKGGDMGLNIMMFDESTMSAPGCSCTGVWRQCYKWGNGGWQSACCTNTLSMHPLPMLTSRKHARIGGRKMSGGAFLKLLNRLAAEGHDLSLPVDLKAHWAKHGTNRYITIK